jgi:6-pyruvoyltetrahydropterin/6-carboxytetrahydropterin synthase
MDVHGGELSITKIFSFCYAHNLSGYNGKCSNVHGHTASLEIEIEKPPRGFTVYKGMIMDFGEIKRIVQEKIVDVLDHKYLNEDIEHFTAINPTAENIVTWILYELEPIFENGLVRIRFYETPTSYAEWVAYQGV